MVEGLSIIVKKQEEKINKLIEEKNESNNKIKKLENESNNKIKKLEEEKNQKIKKLENAIKEIKEQLIPLKEVKIKKENYENFRESKILINKNDIILFSNFIIPKFKN